MEGLLKMQAIHNAIDNEQKYVVQSYIRPDFVLVRGDGITLYDENDKAY